MGAPKDNPKSSHMETVVFGKWILAGEHAVLRGVPALVFPVFGRRLELRYSEEGKAPSVEFSGEHGDELRLLFWGVVEKALEMTGRTHAEASGKFSIMSTIPVGAGMGASAALCVAIGRWFSWRGWVGEEELPEFCRQLENLFHGESSGVDIAVALSGKGLRFERSGERSPFEPRWEPDWYISHSGKRGVTSECIAKVRELWKRDRAFGELIDRDMRDAVALAEAALLRPSAEEGFVELGEALGKARTCFERWGLAGGECGAHLQWLLHHGAYAVKPTGSGDGGFVLSLWRTPPPDELRSQLIPLSARTLSDQLDLFT
jgi:mevalonate kinase